MERQRHRKKILQVRVMWCTCVRGSGCCCCFLFFFAALNDEGQSVCMCVKEGEGEGGCQLGAAKCRVTGGVFETEKESLVVSEKELSGCKLRRCCCNSVVV